MARSLASTSCVASLAALKRQAEWDLIWFSRSTRRSPSKSRTLASGSGMTRAPAPTTCTRSSATSRAPTPSRASTRTWPPATVPVSGRSTSVLVMVLVLYLTFHADPACRRDRKVCGHPPSVYQAAHDAEPQVPLAPPRHKGPLHLCRSPPRHLLNGVCALKRVRVDTFDVLWSCSMI